MLYVTGNKEKSKIKSSCFATFCYPTQQTDFHTTGKEKGKVLYDKDLFTVIGLDRH